MGHGRWVSMAGHVSLISVHEFLSKILLWDVIERSFWIAALTYSRGLVDSAGTRARIPKCLVPWVRTEDRSPQVFKVNEANIHIREYLGQTTDAVEEILFIDFAFICHVAPAIIVDYQDIFGVQWGIREHNQLI